jgi:hypothetical protein
LQRCQCFVVRRFCAGLTAASRRRSPSRRCSSVPSGSATTRRPRRRPRRRASTPPSLLRQCSHVYAHFPAAVKWSTVARWLAHTPMPFCVRSLCSLGSVCSSCRLACLSSLYPAHRDRNAMRLEIPAPLFGRSDGKCPSFPEARRRKLPTHRSAEVHWCGANRCGPRRPRTRTSRSMIAGAGCGGSAGVECEGVSHRGYVEFPYGKFVQPFPKGVGRGRQGGQKPPWPPCLHSHEHCGARLPEI